MNLILKKITELRRSNISEGEQLDELMRSSVFDSTSRHFSTSLLGAQFMAGRFARYILYKLDMIYGGRAPEVAIA